MNSDVPVRFRTDSLNLLELALKYWKILILTSVAAFIISAVISLTYTPLFRSVAVLYPTTNVVETQTLFGIQSNATPLFGDETATEKVLQILISDNIKNYLVSEYDLMNHYGISPMAKYKYTLLDARIKKYFVSKKTQYNSVEISVLDSDPALAATMANDIARQADTVFNQIVRDAGRKAYSAISKTYDDQLRRVKSLEDSLKTLRLAGDMPAFSARIKAGSPAGSWASAQGNYNPEFLRLMNMFESENENLSAIRSRLTEAKMLAEQRLPYIHIINEAKVSEKKALPRRSAIVLTSTAASVLLVFFVLAFADMIVRDERHRKGDVRQP